VIIVILSLLMAGIIAGLIFAFIHFKKKNDTGSNDVKVKCDEDAQCNTGQKCFSASCCDPVCKKVVGSKCGIGGDGCGGDCKCDDSLFCVNGQCSNCEGVDGSKCGGSNSCGCNSGLTCNNEKCCTPVGYMGECNPAIVKCSCASGLTCNQIIGDDWRCMS